MDKNQRNSEAIPNPRAIRRACGRELYRTAKRLNARIPAEKMKTAVEIYFRKMIPKLIWIYENRNNRKVLADWWEQEVGPEIAQLWEVKPEELARAFRSAFGG